MTSAALVQFDPALVRDRELRFVSLAMGASSASVIESWTALPPPNERRPWDLAALLVVDEGGWVAIFSRPRGANVRGTKDITWMDLRGALAEAFLAGALSRHRKGLPEGVLSIVRSEAAVYADKNHRAVGQ